MMYSKVTETIEKDKSFIWSGHFEYASLRYRIIMVFSRGPHCKEVQIFYNRRHKVEPFLVITDLEKLRELFYMGNFHRNLDKDLKCELPEYMARSDDGKGDL